MVPANNLVNRQSPTMTSRFISNSQSSGPLWLQQTIGRRKMTSLGSRGPLMFTIFAKISCTWTISATTSESSLSWSSSLLEGYYMAAKASPFESSGLCIEHDRWRGPYMAWRCVSSFPSSLSIDCKDPLPLCGTMGLSRKAEWFLHFLA